jgi:hypothetical protein
MDMKVKPNEIFYTKTFLAYFGYFSNVFFGNVGRHTDVIFPERPEVFNMENAIEENLFHHTIENDCTTLRNVKKVDKFKSLQSTNAKVYKARFQKLVLNHDHLLKLLKQDKKNKNKENIAMLFQKFLVELQNLQENFKYQRDAIIRNHMIDIFGHFENADDNSFDFRNVTVSDFF